MATTMQIPAGSALNHPFLQNVREATMRLRTARGDDSLIIQLEGGTIYAKGFRPCDVGPEKAKYSRIRLARCVYPVNAKGRKHGFGKIVPVTDWRDASMGIG